jgi:hypothetical protein
MKKTKQPKPLSLEDFKKEVHRLDPKLEEDDPGFSTALVLLVALQVGADAQKISDFTKIPLKRVKKLEKNFRANKVWVGKKTCCDWWDKKSGSIAFWCDVLVAEGMLKRTNDKKVK